MKQLLNPKSVAVIGASHDSQKIGYQVFDNLLSGFSGRVFAVNPKSDTILGHPTYKTILDIPTSVDLAIICVPAPLVLKVLESCGKKKVKAAIIITSGFSEAGTSGKNMESDILKVAQKHKIQVLGPNCLGVINNFTGLNASFATAKLPAKYRVGIFSQSGAMGSAMLDFANGSGFGFSYFVSLGNKMDISEVDLLEAWAEDDNVEVAVGYLEDIKDGDRFMAAAKKLCSKKPLIILKGGMTKAGEKAASLHTAALAQDELVFKAAMEEAGVILARNLNDLFELAVAFSQNHLPKGKNLAVISNAGGPSVLAADAADHEHVTMAVLSPHTTAVLSKETMAASIANPIDLRGDARSADFRVALRLAEKDKGVDGILLIVTPQSMTEIEGIAWEAVRARREGGKPVYVNFIGGELVERGISICRENGVSTFPFPERAIRAFRFQANFEARKMRNIPQMNRHPKHKVAKSIISFGKSGMNPDRLASLLSVYDIPMAKTILVRNPAEAKQAFSEIRPPVVMKILSPDILHKTDVGGVILGVSTEKEAQEAFEKIVTNVKRAKPEAEIKGVTVMETAREGLEVIVGAKRDATFGPVLVFGAGGILVELISDYALSVGPFDEQKIRDMISKTKVSRILKGYRSDIKYSEKKLTAVLMALGSLVTDHPEILSVEINPLILEDNGRGAMGLDAKIEVQK
jgi:acetate---CoA ligase (ADP-forming)